MSRETELIKDRLNIEEIVGEIEDEYDTRFTDIKKIGAGKYISSGYCLIDKINEALNIKLPVKDFIMLNGLIVSSVGHVPKRLESVDLGPINCLIKQVDGHRIIQLEITLKTK